ncbi:MAG: hypothetical protein ACKVW3_13250 [Phycisphaerales bacterium]
MISLMVHSNKVFEDQTLYASGHAYESCQFRRCTFIYTGQPASFGDCVFESCAWHISMLAFDADQWDSFVTELVPAITKSLPRKPA